MTSVMLRKKQGKERELLNKNTAKYINKDIQYSAQTMKQKNISGLNKTPSIAQRNTFDIDKRNFIKKGILGFAIGAGIAALSKIKTVSALQSIVWDDGTSQTAAASGGGIPTAYTAALSQGMS